MPTLETGTGHPACEDMLRPSAHQDDGVKHEVARLPLVNLYPALPLSVRDRRRSNTLTWIHTPGTVAQDQHEFFHAIVEYRLNRKVSPYR